MGVVSTRSTNSAPVSLSTSYLTGSLFIGISMMTLMSFGRSRPLLTSCRLIAVVAPEEGVVGKAAHYTGRAPGSHGGKPAASRFLQRIRARIRSDGRRGRGAGRSVHTNINKRGDPMNVEMIPALMGVVGLVAACVVYAMVRRYPAGEGRVAEIAELIHTGAMVFMRREYSILAVFVAVVTIALFIAFPTWHTAVAFIAGALASAIAGWIGMYTATRANVRTTMAANAGNTAAALSVAFFGGSIMGLTVAAMGLLGLGLLYVFFGAEHAEAIHGFGMGASSVALFSRVG